MTRNPVADLVGKGYEPPHCTQFSVFLDNRVGKLLNLVEVFDGQALRLVALSIADAAEYAVVRIVTSRAELARRLLQRHLLPYSETEILVVELRRDQTLTKLCKALLSAEVSMCFAFPLMVRPHGGTTIGLHTDDQVTAGQILRHKMFVLLGEQDLAGGGMDEGREIA